MSAPLCTAPRPANAHVQGPKPVVACRGGGQFALDNRWVVPYNRLLSLMFNAHINVEVVTSIRCVKYLYKYIYKGPDAVSYPRRRGHWRASRRCE